jgi:ABC-2 type transport system ATP-binding protein
MSNIIEVKNLVKRYGNSPEGELAVDDISFSVPQGISFAFLGPNGAGKTTTIKILTTLLHPTSGTVRVNGHDPVHEQNAVRKSFGIVFQDQSLDDELTAEENMEFHGVVYGVPRDVRRRRIVELLDLVELRERQKDLVKNFSGGMRRRLEIARGLLHHPKIFFLDEPTLGLDPQTRNHIWEHIKKLNKSEGITVFFTTHYMEEADRYADRVAIIDHGKIIAEGTPEELKRRAGGGTLEEAFLSLTGHAIREESLGAKDALRMNRRMWRR